MKIEEVKNLEVTSIGQGTEDSIEANINKSSMPFLFEMMSKSLYKNPIGSMIREITSNCFDSHREAGVDDPVVIKVDEDEEGRYISFNDYGVGLSPSRIRKVYMNFFSSTKRETNDLIGGFGLGSKTPLAYTDLFYINTVFDGTKYHYCLHKGESKPTLELLLEETTSERNGTEVRVHFQLKGQDRYIDGRGYDIEEVKFFEEVRSQLCYFDNVFFQNCWGISNEYTIYEGEGFKYRSDSQYSSEMHIVLSKVSYPIDWNEIGMSSITVPVGVKFEIGELQVTPSRESIRYTDEAKSLIIERISIVKKELIDIYKEQTTGIVNIVDYLKKDNKRPKISFGDNSEDHLYLNQSIGIEKIVKFEPLKDYFDKLPNNPFFDFQVIDKLDGGSIKKAGNYNVIDLIVNNKRLIIISGQYTKMKNCYLGYGHIIRYKPVRDISDHLGFRAMGYFSQGDVFDLGWSMKAYKFRKEMKKQMSMIAIQYDKEPEKYWVDDYKLNLKNNDTALRRRLNKEISIKYVGRYETIDYIDARSQSKFDGDRSDIKIEKLDKRTGITIYGFRDDYDKLHNLYIILSRYKRFTVKVNKAFYLNSKAIIIIQIAKGSEKYLINNPKACSIKQFMSNNKIFRRIATAALIRDLNFINNYDANFSEKLKLINREKAKKIEVLEKYVKEYIKPFEDGYTNRGGYSERLLEEILSIAQQNNIFDEDIISIVKELEEWYKGIEIFKFVQINEKSIPYIISYMKEKGKRVNSEHYMLPAVIEKQNKEIIITHK